MVLSPGSPTGLKEPAGLLLVTPDVRPSAISDDQGRVATPDGAGKLGDHPIGRQCARASPFGTASIGRWSRELTLSLYRNQSLILPSSGTGYVGLVLAPAADLTRDVVPGCRQDKVDQPSPAASDHERGNRLWLSWRQTEPVPDLPTSNTASTTGLVQFMPMTHGRTARRSPLRG